MNYNVKTNYIVREKLNSCGVKHRIFQPNDIVRHFKGNLYRIITIARNTETKELEVVYEALYPYTEDGRRAVWVRPYRSFESMVDRDMYPYAEQEYVMEIVEFQNALDDQTAR